MNLALTRIRPCVQTTPPPLTVTVRPQSPQSTDHPVSIDVQGLNFFYGAKRALENISIGIPAKLVTAFIGPSGCGKSTFLRTLNRMNDIIAGTRVEGHVLIDGDDIYRPGTDVVALRRRVGMVFQKSNPVPEVHLRKRGLRAADQRPCRRTAPT